MTFSSFKKFIKLVLSNFKKKDFPGIVNYDITSNCNLNCEHCYWRKTYNPKKEISDKEWIKIFKDHVKKGTTMAYITGGEPTLRINLIRAAYKIFPKIAIASNGIIKIPEDIQCRINISLDGPERIHNKIRGAKVFRKIMENMKNDRRVIISSTLSTTNYKYIEEMVNITRDLNVEGIFFSFYTSHSGENDPLYLKGKELDWTINKLLKLQKKNKDIIFMTPGMIKSLKEKKYINDCYFRNPDFLALDANMNRKSPCTLGIGAICSTCGCIVPMMGYALKNMDISAWVLFRKFYPERYYGDR